MYLSMKNTIYKTIEDKNNKLKSLNGRTKFEFYKNINEHFDQMIYMRQSNSFEFEEDTFSKVAPGITMIMHEALFIKKLSQT